MFISFITCISTSGDAGWTQMGNRNSKVMALVSRRYERVKKSAKHQAPDAEDHKLNTIGRYEMDSRSYTCCDVRYI